MASGGGRRARGQVESLPSGAVRVSVYAGIDPVSKKRFYLRETVPAGPKVDARAERARVRLVNEVYERRNPRTDATVSQLIDRHLKEADLDSSTRSTYDGYIKKHVRPLVGSKKVASLDADILDAFYAELRRCRDHCSGGPRIDHRTSGSHECDTRCGAHICRPLSASTIRQIHWILSGALRRAVRWKWLSANPASLAEPPAPTKSNPRPPSADEAARIVTEAWKDPDWGTLVWLTMVTGLRRGELCAIRWTHLDLSTGVLHLEKSIGQRGKEVWEKDTKTHQDRRIFLDADTIDVLREHRARFDVRVKLLETTLDPSAYVFSLSPDGSAHLRPDSITSRYNGMVKRLGIKTTIHKLRHYSATELIMAGVNVRTVAGRLGHSGGGTTTLRTYTAWVSEADQRAAKELATRMPARPRAQASNDQLDPGVSARPFRVVAADLRQRIADGSLPAGLPLPSIKQLAADHDVAVGTAQRAVALLREWGLVEVMAGRRTLVKRVELADNDDGVAPQDVSIAGGSADILSGDRVEALDVEVRRRNDVVARFSTDATLENSTLHRVLLGAVKRSGGTPEQIDDYELIVRRSGSAEVVAAYVATSR